MKCSLRKTLIANQIHSLASLSSSCYPVVFGNVSSLLPSFHLIQRRSIYSTHNHKILYNNNKKKKKKDQLGNIIRYDFRSDTLTLPSKSMLDCIYHASLGDDVYEEDPSVNELQDFVAHLSGHESALFGVTGTMMNQIAIRTHLKQPPYSVICDHRSHVYRYEASGISFHSAHVIPIQPKNYHHLSLNDIEMHVILSQDIHEAPTQLICLENTLNGTIFPFDELQKISDFAKANQIALHLDGARLWNACMAAKVTLETYCKLFDSVSLCLSKGLGAPMGSVLVGNKKFIRKAKHFRKLFGGGWRQAGGLAAAGMFAIQNQWERMSDDHTHAKLIYKALKKLDLHSEDIPTETNMVWLDTSRYKTALPVQNGFSQRIIKSNHEQNNEKNGQHVYRPLYVEDLAQHFLKKGIRISGGAYTEGRIVTHLGINREAVHMLSEALHEFLMMKENQIIPLSS